MSFPSSMLACLLVWSMFFPCLNSHVDMTSLEQLLTFMGDMISQQTLFIWLLISFCLFYFNYPCFRRYQLGLGYYITMSKNNDIYIKYICIKMSICIEYIFHTYIYIFHKDMKDYQKQQPACIELFNYIQIMFWLVGLGIHIYKQKSICPG